MSDILSQDPPPPPASHPRDQLSDHAYDDIQEYDNPTPGWWVAIFVVSVFFAFFYFVYYHSAVPDRSIYDRYGDSVAADLKKKLAALGVTNLTVTEANMLQWMANKDYMQYGKAVFKQNCISCHGGDGQGMVGPNLTDDYYKNIKVITDIPRIISTGAANGNMPSWQRLGSVDIALVGAYVASLRGKELPGPLGQQGDKIAPWPPLPEAPAPAPATTQK